MKSSWYRLPWGLRQILSVTGTMRVFPSFDISIHVLIKFDKVTLSAVGCVQLIESNEFLQDQSVLNVAWQYLYWQWLRLLSIWCDRIHPRSSSLAFQVKTTAVDITFCESDCMDHARNASPSSAKCFYCNEVHCQGLRWPWWCLGMRRPVSLQCRSCASPWIVGRGRYQRVLCSNKEGRPEILGLGRQSLRNAGNPHRRMSFPAFCSILAKRFIYRQLMQRALIAVWQMMHGVFNFFAKICLNCYIQIRVITRSPNFSPHHSSYYSYTRSVWLLYTQLWCDKLHLVCRELEMDGWVCTHGTVCWWN